jgi:hypothetical protein
MYRFTILGTIPVVFARVPWEISGCWEIIRSMIISLKLGDGEKKEKLLSSMAHLFVHSLCVYYSMEEVKKARDYTKTRVNKSGGGEQRRG